jgi:hypothetical protein
MKSICLAPRSRQCWTELAHPVDQTVATQRPDQVSYSACQIGSSISYWTKLWPLSARCCAKLAGASRGGGWRDMVHQGAARELLEGLFNL